MTYVVTQKVPSGIQPQTSRASLLSADLQLPEISNLRQLPEIDNLQQLPEIDNLWKLPSTLGLYKDRILA